MYEIASSIAGFEPRVPRPPGTRSRSRGGAVAKVWVGITLWPMALADAGDFVVTGSRVEDMSAKVTLWLHERTLIQSIGPNTSRA